MGLDALKARMAAARPVARKMSSSLGLNGMDKTLQLPVAQILYQHRRSVQADARGGA